MVEAAIISELLKLVNPILVKKANEEVTFPIEFTSCHVLERIQSNLNTLGLLLEVDPTKHYHAIGLILRNMLTDFINTGYIINTSSSEDVLIEKFYLLYNADLKRMGTFIKCGIIEQNEIGSLIKLVEEHPLYKVIKEVSKGQESKSFPTTLTIIKEFLKREEKCTYVQQIIKSYDVWELLSKYEHIGLYSYNLTRNLSRDLIVNRINFVLNSVTIMIRNCFELLKEEEAIKDSNEILRRIGYV